MRAPAPAYASNDGVIDAAGKALGARVLSSLEAVGEVSFTVDRESLIETMTLLRDAPGLEYQQLMEIAGVDYPDRPDRFDVVYCLLSLTRNHRIRVHVQTDEVKPVPSVTGIWPVAGWLEREVYDMYGVLFEGNPDLRRILTDYGFVGHPQRKDFPLTGYVELRYSEETKRVAYEPVQLAQDFRTFDFMSPWEGAEYVLPGDEKGLALPEAKGAPTPLKADAIQKADAAETAKAQPATPKTTDSPAQTGAGKDSPDGAPTPAKAKAKPKKGGDAAPPPPTDGKSANAAPDKSADVAAAPAAGEAPKQRKVAAKPRVKPDAATATEPAKPARARKKPEPRNG
ncbi:MAG: NADH-quinone oxidoreductase subunit C [Sphingomonas sp.]|uniref:NADH-quinone oxidoreductase subunit C n=1 Tax=Sphingomonas sp. TaxID=28214 RepID=UPI001AC2A496|nr:NADH-quinone oxidoreductase subunit C [Sphingomonas sp.]MBN8807191.1 NADH-quinone oxidoreductase subunit C [Sphingomonas sp.]